MNLEIKPIIWRVFEGQFSNDLISDIPGISVNFCIWVDRTTGKTKVSGLDRKHSFHNSIDEAKEFCQIKLSETINSFLKLKECE